MGSRYLLPADYEIYGLDDKSVNETKVRAASQLIDAYIARPQGLIYVEDVDGLPCYMESPNAVETRAVITSPVPAGDNVVVSYSGPRITDNDVSLALVLDRSNSDLMETCVVSGTDKENGTVTFQHVARPHDVGCKMESGLVIMEERELPHDRSIARVAFTPISRMFSGSGRYGYGRRSTQIAGNMQEFNLLATVSNFGGPPLWVPWSVDGASISSKTGEVWVPAGVLLAYFTDVRMWYISGFSRSALPDNVKQACANIILLGRETGLGANIRSRSMRDSTSVTKWENKMIDADTRSMLQPYVAKRYV